MARLLKKGTVNSNTSLPVLVMEPAGASVAVTATRRNRLRASEDGQAAALSERNREACSKVYDLEQ